MAKVKDTDFLFISTYLRARENNLLSHERMERMLEARSDDDAAKVLSECGYTGLEPLSQSALAASFSRARAAMFAELASMSPNGDIVDVFRVKYDYHNAKALMKCVSSGQDASAMLIDAGRYSIPVISAAVLQENYSPLSDDLRRAIVTATEVLSATGDPQRSDFLLDQACFSEMLQLAKRSGSRFLQDYVALQIDAANLKSMVRALRMKKGADFLRGVLLQAGNVSITSMNNVFVSGGALETIFTGYLQEAAALGTAASKGGRQTAFEQAVDNALNAYLQSSRLTAFGDSVLIAYAAAKENEITAARIIMSGRLAGVSTEAIRERLRDTYV